MASTQASSLTDIPGPSGPWEYADAEEGYEYTASVEFNKMSYVDAAGKTHEIHIPTGKAAEACEHFVNEDWEELAKFPKWGKFLYSRRFDDDKYLI
jgi:hypothetical protein